MVDGTIWKNTQPADLVSKEQFGDFELAIEWRIGEAGNSGIFYRGTEEYDTSTGRRPEYQLLDDEKADGQQVAADVRGRRVRPLSVAAGTPEACRPVERDADYREGPARGALAERRRSCSSTSCGARIGKRR